ncbi:sensor histidine kinase [Natronospora cellulosivora (SeqCode)]
MKYDGIGDNMKYYYISIIYLWLLISLMTGFNIDYLEIIFLLGSLALFILKERFFDNFFSSLCFLLIAVAGHNINMNFLLLAAIPAFDSGFKKNYLMAILLITPFTYYSYQLDILIFVLPIAFSILAGYIYGDKLEKEEKYIEFLDKERRLRYQLEQTKSQLLHSRKEIKRLTEIRERNRIARQIHDSIGHSIAGVLFQLQAALKIFKKDEEKTENILKLCLEKLSEALELTRKTVYNIKDYHQDGLKLIKEIIDNFEFCPIEFSFEGNFNNIPVDILEIILSNIKESLTNTAKYSEADKVKINLKIGKKVIRLYYKDNGQGCKQVIEGMGLTGMRERVNNAGGTISTDGSDGFLIVCNIPFEREMSDESFNS